MSMKDTREMHEGVYYLTDLISRSCYFARASQQPRSGETPESAGDYRKNVTSKARRT